MFAIIGLGNPGSQYEKTRHNAGFWVVDKLAQENNLPTWREKSGCSYIKENLFNQQCLLIKPQKYMNLSGSAASALLKFFQVPIENVVVVYDDLDLAPGVIRIRKGGGSGGHNGVEDCISHFGSANFIRIRLGIGRPNFHSASEQESQIARANESITSWVLGNPRPEEEELLLGAVQKSVEAVELLLREGLLVSQNKFNRN